MMDYPCDPRAGVAPGVLVVQAGGHGRLGGDRASTGCGNPVGLGGIARSTD
jgi:hypothetical protein